MRSGWLHRARGLRRKTLLLLFAGASDYIDGPVMPPEDEPPRRRRRWGGYAIDGLGGRARRTRRRRQRGASVTGERLTSRSVTATLARRRAASSARRSGRARVVTVARFREIGVTAGTLAGTAGRHVKRHVRTESSRAVTRWQSVGNWVVRSPADYIEEELFLALQIGAAQ